MPWQIVSVINRRLRGEQAQEQRRLQIHQPTAQAHVAQAWRVGVLRSHDWIFRLAHVVGYQMNATQQHGMPRVLSAHECATWSAWSRHRVSCEQCQKFSRGHDVNGLLCETGLMLWDEWMLAAGATKRTK